MRFLLVFSWCVILICSNSSVCYSQNKKGKLSNKVNNINTPPKISDFEEKKSYQGYALDILKSENKKLTELTPELNLCFNSWKDYLNVNQIFDIPKDDICKEYENGNLEYDFSKKNMPLKISLVKYLKFKSKETECFFIKYELDNCLRGNGYYRDFVIFIRKGDKIEFDTTFTNHIKNNFKQTIFNKLDIKSDDLCFTDQNSNFVHTDGLIILDFIDDNIIGKYALQGNGANCCPQYSGDFEYSISNNTMTLKNGIYENQDFDNNETIEYSNPSVNIKTKKHPVTSKNKLVTSSIQITKEEKEALRQFIGFCKIQVYVQEENYTSLIFSALKINGVSSKNEIKTKLESVITDIELKKSFLTYFSQISGNNFQSLFQIISPPRNIYIVTLSASQASTLTNYILKKFPFSPIKLEDTEDVIEPQKEEPITFTYVEKTAEYVGGYEAMNKFINKNLILPKSNSTSNEETNLRIDVNFIIEKDGTISNIKIDKSRYETEKFENCIIQCFQKMPKWKPAEQSGKPIRISWREPVIISTSN